MNSKDFRNIREAKKLLKAYDTQSEDYTVINEYSKEIGNRMKEVERIFNDIHRFGRGDDQFLTHAETEFQKMVSSMLQLINDMDSFIEEGRQDPPDYR